MFSTVFVFFVCCLFQKTVSESCTTPNGEVAECIGIYDCDVLYNSIRSADPLVKEFIQKSFCGYTADDKPAVCCGNSSSYEVLDRNPIILGTRRNNLLPDRRTCGYQLYEDKILNGDDTGIAEYPWMALLTYRNANGETRFKCGGTLISSRYVITAAHCLTVKGFQLTSVRLGEWNTETEDDCVGKGRYRFCAHPPLNIEIESTKKHEDYRRTRQEVTNDIGLIRLKTAVTFNDFIQPICLPLGNQEHTRVGNTAVVSGWGITETKRRSPIKQKLAVPIVRHDQCKKIYEGHQFKFDDKKICAGGEKDKDSCQGDSGGPLIAIVANSTAQHYIEGIVSFGAVCGTEGIPGVYTKVSEYLDWIVDNVKP